MSIDIKVPVMIKRLPNLRKLPILLLVFLLLAGAVGIQLTRADELDEVTGELAQQQQQLADLEKAKDQLAKDISSASVSLYQVSSQLEEAEAELAEIEQELADKEKTLAQWETDRNLLIRDLYKQGSRHSSFDIFLSENDLDSTTKSLYYYDENLNLLKERIGLLNEEIQIFQANQAAAKELRDELADLRNQYSARLASSQSQFSSTSSQLSQVKSSIKNLTAKQEQLILEKFAATQGSETVGESPPPSEPIPATTFSPAWMVATYGYPHRIGMSQYGARGRAMSGGGSQSYQTILKAYYGTSATKATNIPSKITVNGCNEYNQCWNNVEYDFETYVKHLYEMPTSWPTEALKAQAVAARTYALRYALQGKTICPSQSCQVIKKEINSSAWQQAVDATKGMVVGGNSPLPTFYHSTAGGYTISKTTWINYWEYHDGIKDYHSGSGKFYEEIAGAPWFHTGWGSRTGSGYIPWMTTEEFADIFNTLIICTTNGQTVADCDYTKYLSPIDKDVNEDGKINDEDAWRMGTLRNKLSDLGITPFSGSNLTAAYTSFTSGNEANTASVYAVRSGNTWQFAGRDFRAVFNLRSRGTLGIWTYRFDIGYCASTGCKNPGFN